MMAEVSYSGYGKNDVRLMRVRRDGDKYFVTELKVNVELQLATTVDFKTGDNRDVVATDSQKNTIMALAKQNTVRRLLCDLLLKISDFGTLPPPSPVRLDRGTRRVWLERLQSLPEDVLTGDHFKGVFGQCDPSFLP